MPDAETYSKKIIKEVCKLQTKQYNFCCIVYPWELYLMEFDLYFSSKKNCDRYSEALRNGYTFDISRFIHWQACYDILLDNDYNKIMSLYTQDYPMT